MQNLPMNMQSLVNNITNFVINIQCDFPINVQILRFT
jgi:hypothetical protein